MWQYGLLFYFQYLAHWPEYFQLTETPGGEIMGYSESPLILPLSHITIVNLNANLIS